MALSPEEDRLWRRAVKDCSQPDRLDPILQAANDFRLARAARWLIGGVEPDVNLDWSELTVMLGEEYFLSPDELTTAMEIAEDQVRHYED